MGKKINLFGKLCAGFFVIICILILIGTFNWIKIIEVKQISHDATLDQLWELWDFDKRKEWDSSLEWIKADGNFTLGQTGLLKLEEQPARKFKITEFEKNKCYTDRFYLPMAGKMDWRHTLEQTGDGIVVKFDISVNGPNALMLLPIMKMILNNTLQGTVNKYIEIAETK
jgi:hypothetical protein